MSVEKFFISHSENDTKLLGYKFGKNIRAGILILLYGDLGTGKTVFVKGVGESQGVLSVRSPSFTLINEYKTQSNLYIIHSDLYRLNESQSDSIGLEDYINSDDCVLFVEWPERLKDLHGSNVIEISFKALNENDREIKIYSEGLKAEEALKDL